MARESPAATVSRLSAATSGVFRGRDAVALGVSRKQLGSLTAAGVIVRELPDTYRMTASVRSPERRLRAALLWGGEARRRQGAQPRCSTDSRGCAASYPRSSFTADDTCATRR